MKALCCGRLLNFYYRKFNETFRNEGRHAVDEFIQHKPGNLLKALDKLFARVGVPMTGDLQQKLADLKLACEQNIPKHSPAEFRELVETNHSRYNSYELKFCACIGEFLKKHGYEEKFLAQNKGFKKIELRVVKPGTPGQVFINTKRQGRIKEFKREYITQPVPGKTYSREQEDNHYFLHNHRDLQKRRGRARVLYWYDHELPEALTGLKLKFKRVPIYTKSRKKAHAWLITDGLENFKTRPRTAFAYRSALKTDCVTLPRLHAAGTKFGLTPNQLALVNDCLVLGGASSTIGAYNKISDRVTLGNRSLGTLAHEGFHRLVAPGAGTAKRISRNGFCRTSPGGARPPASARDKAEGPGG